MSLCNTLNDFVERWYTNKLALSLMVSGVSVGTRWWGLGLFTCSTLDGDVGSKSTPNENDNTAPVEKLTRHARIWSVLFIEQQFDHHLLIGL